MPKLGEVIERANRIKPNRYGDEVLTCWVSDLDGRAALEVMGQDTAPEYKWPEDGDRELLVPSPFSRVYELYLTAMIDFHNREMESYQNDMEAFNDAMSEWMAWYRRTNLPKGTGGYANVLY